MVMEGAYEYAYVCCIIEDFHVIGHDDLDVPLGRMFSLFMSILTYSFYFFRQHFKNFFENV